MRYSIHLITLFVSLFFFSCQTKAQERTPEVVKQSFKAKYPEENDSNWHMDKNGNFETHFKKGDDNFRADFAPDGKWIETEESIKKKKLPKPVFSKLEADYSDYKIVEIEKVDHHSKGLFYDVELKKDGEKTDVEFTSNGNIIN